LCRREEIAQGLYYTWSKEFLGAGKKRLSGNTARQATSGEVTGRNGCCVILTSCWNTIIDGVVIQSIY